MAGDVLVHREGVCALLTLSNPTKRNALDSNILARLPEQLDTLPREGVRAIVLQGEGDRAFCAGYDLDALDGSETESESSYSAMIRSVANCTVPVIAALNGAAIGGGCELAMTCDLRVGHDDVSFRMPPARLGLIYPPEGLLRFIGIIGASRTRELFLTGLPITASRALSWGMLDHLVPRADVLPTAMQLAVAIAAGVAGAIAGTRRAIEQLVMHAPPSLRAALDDERRLVWNSDEALAARAALRSPKSG